MDTLFNEPGAALDDVVLAGDLIEMALATPSFDPPGGAFQTTQSVVLTTSSSTATIHYTTDGSEPTTGDPWVTSGGSVNVDQTLTLKARAYESGLLPSGVGSAYFAFGDLEIVDWTNAVGVAASPGQLTKTAPKSMYDAGASSTRALLSGDGYVELTVEETGTGRALGLSHGDADQRWRDIDFSLTLSGGQLGVSEPGDPDPVSYGPYAVASGDRLRVAVESGQVAFYRNGQVLHTSAVAPVYPLQVDTALDDPGATLKDVVISGTLGDVLAPAGFDPPQGVYASPQQVTLTAGSPTASVHYTTDGSEPDESHPSVLPGGAVSVGATATLRARAFEAGVVPSSVAVSGYGIGSPSAAAAEWTNVTGLDASPGQLVKTAGDGWNARAISVQALAAGDGSVELTAPELSSRTLSLSHEQILELPPDGGTYGENIPGYRIRLNAAGGVYLREHGGTESAHGSYQAGDTFRISIDGGVASAWHNGALLKTFEYAPVYPMRAGAFLYSAGATLADVTLTGFLTGGALPAPAFSPPGGTYPAPQDVVLTSAAGSTIHFTTDGTEPDETDPSVTSGGSVLVDLPLTLRAKAFGPGAPSPVTQETYDFQAATPTASPPGGTYTDPVDVTLTTATPGAEIRYTTDGTTLPDATSDLYVGPVHIADDTTLMARALRASWTDSGVMTEFYDIQPALTAPVMTPPSGTYTTSVEVSISADAGTTIRYTTDGSEPDETAPVYSAPLAFEVTTTLKAKAFQAGYTPSDTASETYEIKVAAPTLTPAGGTYAGPVDVTLATTTPGSTIHYTTNGLDPAETDPSVVSGGIVTISTSATLKARGFKPGTSPSDVASESYDVATGPAVVDVIVAPLKGSLVDGEELQFYATAKLEDGTAADVTPSATWASSNTGVATVAGGLATATMAGSTTISAEYSGFEGSAPLTVTAADPLPPDPATVAPPLDLTVATTLDRAAEFLYAGAQPIQLGVNVASLDVRHTAVLRGLVLDVAGQPLPGVRIRILDHPEYGRTQSRADGMFDMVVNGGGDLVVRYEKGGFPPVDRRVEVPWQDYVWAPDVVMTPHDTEVSVVNLTSSTVQVARGSAVTDADGTRQATLVFLPGTQAQAEYADGTSQPLDLLHVRATEYTVGDLGPERMPADLPPTTAYTYAAELSADEALQADHVSFSQPVVLYLENYLGFFDGDALPLGAYDRTRGEWEAAPDGRVVTMLDVQGGLADLDVDGDGVADDATTLAELGIADAERQTLAGLYTAPQSLWRVQLPHFSPYDINPLLRIGATGPPPHDPKAEEASDDPEETCGSVIDIHAQVLCESIPITGTPFSQKYRSEHTLAYERLRTFEVTLSEASVHSELRRIDFGVLIAGQRHEMSFAPTPGLSQSFTWDGRDAYGRPVQGRSPGLFMRTTYIYPTQYPRLTPTVGNVGSWARSLIESGVSWSSNEVVERPNGEAGLDRDTWMTFPERSVGVWDAKALELGGWSLDVHHSYDPLARILHKGDGSRQSAQSWPAVIPTAAGNGTAGFGGDGGPATAAQFDSPEDVAVAPDGSLYIADQDNNRIRRVDPDGIVTTFAGTGSCGNESLDLPATQVDLCNPSSVAVDPRGELYIFADGRVVRVDVDGIARLFAGNGEFCSPEGGCLPWEFDVMPATEVPLGIVLDLAVARDGGVLMVTEGSRLRRVDPDGIITTFEDLEATAVAVAPDDSLYVADRDHRVMRLTPDGSLERVAGTDTGIPGFGGDGGPATEAQLRDPMDIAFGPDGSFYIADQGNYRVRRVFPNGRIITAAGDGLSGFAGENGPAPKARFGWIEAIAVDPEGRLFVVDSGNQRIRRVESAFPRFTTLGLGNNLLLADRDENVIHLFTPHGRHLETRHADTGFVLYSFVYENNLLTEIHDGDGNVTQVVRDASGDPTSIVAPGGQTTLLALDGNGYLQTVTNPASESIGLVHDPNGLLTSMTDARGGVHTYTYEDGLLVRDEDPAMGFKELSSPAEGTVVVTTAEGRASTYQRVELEGESETRTTTDPAGFVTEELIGADGERTTTHPDGTIVTVSQGPDPRWGMQAPLTTDMTYQRPSGMTTSVTLSRDAVLSDPSNPLTLQTLTDTLSVNGDAWTSVFDATTLTQMVTSPEGRQRTYEFDSQGRVRNVAIPGLSPAAYEYDTEGRLESVVQGTRSLNFEYDGMDRLSKIRDSLLQETELLYDGADRVTEFRMPGNRVALFGYDGNGNVTGVTPPGRPVHGFDYTPVDLVETYLRPDLGQGADATASVWNKDWQLDALTRPGEPSLDVQYDSGGRLERIVFQGGQIDYAYDAATAVLDQVSDSEGRSLAFTYDGALETGTTWTGEVSGSVSRTYNADLRLETEQVNGAHDVTYVYDDDGLLEQVGALGLHRDPANGLVTGTTLGNVTDSYIYDEHGDVERYTASYDGTMILDLAYVRDDLGRIEQITETIAGVTRVFGYTYLPAGHLETVSRDGTVIASYTYDDNGNRLTESGEAGSFTATYDDRDRLLTRGGAAYTYSPAGDLIAKTEAGLTTYQYDAFGNLSGVTLPDGRVVEFVVDAIRNRVGKKVDGVVVQRRLYGSNQEVVAELDASGAVETRYVYTNPLGAPAYMVRDGRTYRTLSDHLGGPRMVVDVLTGVVEQRLDYDAWGNIVEDTNPGFQAFAFTGREWDPETGLYYHRARFYDPWAGRFLHEDPIRFQGGINLYAYVDNNPTNFIDPSGQQGLAPFTPVDFINMIRNHFVDPVTIYREGRERQTRYVPPEDQSQSTRWNHCVTACIAEQVGWPYVTPIALDLTDEFEDNEGDRLANACGRRIGRNAGECWEDCKTDPEMAPLLLPPYRSPYPPR